MRRCILHIGMMGTGSAAIRAALARSELPGIDYVDFGNQPRSDHSLPLTVLFARDQRVLGPAYRAHGLSEEDLDLRRQAWDAALEKALTDPARRDILLSADGLSAKAIDRGVLLRLKERIEPHVDGFVIIAYVPPPVLWMEGRFLQQLKLGGTAALVPEQIYPHYRQRLQQWVRVFGQKALTLVKYDRRTLAGGDVVTDFAGRIGTPLAAPASRPAETGPSLQATAALFALHRADDMSGEEGTPLDDIRLAAVLGALGDTRMRFAPTLAEPMLEENARDLHWVSKRAGEDIRDPFSATPNVSSEEDLLATAAGLVPALEALARQQGVPEDEISAAGGAGEGAAAALTGALRRHIAAQAAG